MNVPFFIAHRYLYSRKRFNTVNIVSLVSAIAICIVSSALVCILSIFNGYESLIMTQTALTDPELMIRSSNNSIIKTNEDNLLMALHDKRIASYSFMLSTEGLIKSKYRQQAIPIIGVDQNYARTVNIDSIIYSGAFNTDTLSNLTAINMGAAIATEMQSGVGFVDAVDIIVPQRIGLINPLFPAGAFKSLKGNIASIFASDMLPTDNTILLSLDSLRMLLNYTCTDAESVAIRLNPEEKAEQVAEDLKNILGDRYDVLTLTEQHPEISHLVAMEKWMSYLILLFILLLAAFNIVSSLSMLLIEKKEDINTLFALGAPRQLIAQIFRFEGILVSMIGASIGIIIGIGLCLAQQQYGLVTIQLGLASMPYPVKIEAIDLFITFSTIFALGYFAAYYPVHYFIRQKLNRN